MELIITVKLNRTLNESICNREKKEAKNQIEIKMVATNYQSEHQKSTSSIISIGHKIRAAVWHAQVEKRLVIGLSSAVKSLSKTPDESLFCILAPPKSVDASSHMLEVLLEAYCYENGIYIIKVDSIEKLTRILGTHQTESCVLIQKNMLNGSLDAEHSTAVENDLVDHCEDLWDVPDKSAVALP